MNDESGRSMLVTGTLIGQIHLCIVDNEKMSSARAEAVTFLTRASASNRRGDLADAAKSWSMALAIFREIRELDAGGDFELVLLWELANCFDKMHRSLDAEQYFFAALELSQTKFGREFSNSYNCINCLGVLYENLGRLEEAIAMYKRSIAGRAKILGKLHWDTAMSLQELGNVYLKLEDYAAALPLLERSLRGFEHAEGPHHNFALFVMNNLTNVYSELGLSEDLLQLLRRLIPRATETFGPEHLLTGAAVREYIRCCGKVNLPEGIAQLIHGYRQSYKQTRSEVARWVLEVC
jgi:tetratricopeptide (TPR) repeat protein